MESILTVIPNVTRHPGELANSWLTLVNKDCGMYKASRTDPGHLNRSECTGNKDTGTDSSSYLHRRLSPHSMGLFGFDMTNNGKVVLCVED